MDKNKKILTFSASLFNVEELNPLFSECSVKVLYTGVNENLSHFDKESVENSIHTIKNMPVVGEWIQEENTFGGHGGKIEILDNDIKFIPTTRPYGVVKENFTYEWEEEELLDGTVRYNLIIHGVILWTSHYEEALNITNLENSQSMEIEIEDGEWDDSINAYRINKFNFLSLCVLGRGVTPCFGNSKFYSLNKDNFQKEFNQMMRELKFSLSINNQEKKEVESVIMFKKLLEKYSITLEDLKEKEIILEEFESEETLKEKLKEVFEVEVEEVVTEEFEEKDESAEAEEKPEEVEEKEVVEDVETSDVEVEKEEFEAKFIKQFELSHEDVRSKLYEGISNAQTFGDNWFWISKVYDNYVIVENEDDGKYYKVDYTKSENSVQIGNSVEIFAMFLTQEEKIALENSRIRVEELEKELNELQIFKANVERENHELEVDGLLAQFGLERNELEDLDIFKFSLSDIEEKCYAILGKKLISKKNFSAETNKNIKLKVNQDETVKQETPYGDLFDKYKK